jgi:gamma-hexachlorocyclohexane dehydrochlorinase
VTAPPTTANAATTEAGHSSVEERLDRMESRWALRDLVSNYCHGVDKHDIDLFMSIWHDDAVWRIGPPFGDFHGAAEVRRALVDVIWPAWRETHHWTTNLTLTFDGTDAADGVCDVNCNGATPDDVMQVVSATYTDRFERRAGRWAIARRDVVIHYFSAVPGVDLAPPAE